MSNVYLDSAAATPLDQRVFEAMKPWFTSEYANPNAIYQSAQRARAAIDNARSAVAKFMNAKPTEIVFTGSGTESCNMAIRGVVEQACMNQKKIHIMTSAIEHSSVLKPIAYLQKLLGIEATILPVNRDGIVSAKDAAASIRPNTVLVTIMLVNNQIGAIQPVSEIGAICRKRKILFHTDACQGPGYLDIDVQALNVDLLSLNASKIYGPKGVGALYIREGTKIAPLIHGGGQEFKMRAGTENVAGIVGFGKAVELLIQENHAEPIRKFRDQLWTELQRKIKGVKLNGSLKNRIANNLNIQIPDIDADTLVRQFDLNGICIATTAACVSGITEPSHVLKAIGLSDKEAKSSIRITIGKNTTKEDIKKIMEKLRKILK